MHDLYERLIAHKLSVWWDVKCLKPGQQWEQGMCKHVFGCRLPSCLSLPPRRFLHLVLLTTCLLPLTAYFSPLAAPGFADGLFGAAIFVPILSKVCGHPPRTNHYSPYQPPSSPHLVHIPLRSLLSQAALGRFTDLTPGSPCDNVLLEYLIALEELLRGAIKAIFPVFVGEAKDGGRSYSNFFRSGGVPACPDTTPAVAAVDEKALEHYERLQHSQAGCCRKSRGPHELATADRSPGGILAKLCRFQGGFVEGDRDAALDAIALQIARMAKEVAAGEVIAEATDGSAMRQPWAPAGRQGRAARRSFCGWLHRLLWPQTEAAKPLITAGHVELADLNAQAGRLIAYDADDAEKAASLASMSVPTPGAGGLVFSPALGNEQGAAASSQAELNPVLAYRAEEHRKSIAKAAREKMQEGRKTGGLRRLMPNASPNDGSAPHEVLVDRYLESSEGGAVQPSTAKRGGVAMLSSDSSAAFSLEARRLSQSQQQRDTKRRLTKVKQARGGMHGTAEAGEQEVDVDGGGGSGDSRSDSSGGVSIQGPRHSVAAAVGLGPMVEEKVQEMEQQAETKEETKEEAEARMAQRLVEMKVRQEEERRRAAEAEAAAQEEERRRPLRVSVGQVGFAALKAIVVERGVPKEQADGCMGKHALRELARRWEAQGAEALAAIEWVEEGEDSADTVVLV